MKYRNILYNNYYSTQAGQLTTKSIQSKFEEETKVFIAEIIPIINKNKSIKILDLGCGTGSFINALKISGYERIEGIDISSEQVSIANQMGLTEVKIGDIVAFLKLSKSKYDLISCMDIIEHFTKDELVELLDLIKLNLNDAGTIIARTPNMDAPYASLYANGDFTHENYLNTQSAVQLFKSIGYHNINIYPSYIRVNGFLKEFVRKILWSVLKLKIKIMIFSTGRSSKHMSLTPNLIIVAQN